MAVSSLVSCSFRYSMTRASPCMALLLGSAAPRLAGSGCGHRSQVGLAMGSLSSGGGLADVQAVQGVGGAQPVADAVQAVAAPGAGGAGVADLLLRAGAVGDDVG